MPCLSRGLRVAKIILPSVEADSEFMGAKARAGSFDVKWFASRVEGTCRDSAAMHVRHCSFLGVATHSINN
jgi:hypothetical protein